MDVFSLMLTRMASTPSLGQHYKRRKSQVTKATKLTLLAPVAAGQRITQDNSPQALPRCQQCGKSLGALNQVSRLR